MKTLLRAAAAVALLSLAGCPKEGGSSQPAPPVPVPVPPPAAAPPPVPTLAGDAGPAQPALAECEFDGVLKAERVKGAKRYEVTVQREPCVPPRSPVERFGAEDVKPGKFFVEFFVPQGASGHLCAYAYDAAGKLVGAAASSKNPMSFEGDGEVVFTGLELELSDPR